MAERTRIKRELNQVKDYVARNREAAAQLLDRIGELWARATYQERLRLAQSIFSKAWVRGGKIVAVEPKPALYPLLEVARQAGVDGEMFHVRERRASLHHLEHAGSIWEVIVILPPGADRPEVR